MKKKVNFLIDDFIRKGSMWIESIYDYDESDYEFADILDDLVRPYVIAEVEGGPDSGQYITVKREKIAKLL